MESRKLYRFKTVDGISITQRLIAIFSAFIIFAAVSYSTYVLTEKSLIWLPILLVIVGMLLAAISYSILSVERSPLLEEIKLNDLSLISKKKGVVEFKNILYTTSDTNGSLTQSFQVRLLNGKSITWNLVGAKTSKEDSEKMTDFICEFKRQYNEYKVHYPIPFPHCYRFIFVNEWGYLYALICFIFVPVLFIADINDFGLWALPIIFIPLFAGIFMMIKKTIIHEKVTIFPNYLVSKKYGRINFDTILRIDETDDPEHPALTLNLKGGRVIFWKTASFGNMTATRELVKQYSEIRHFIKELCEILDRLSIEATSSVVKLPLPVSPHKVVNGSLAMSSQEFRAANDHNKSFVPRKQDSHIPHFRSNKGRYWGVTVGGLFALMIFVRQCIDTRQENNNPLRQTAQQSMAAESEAVALLQQFTVKNGPYFLYSNDDSIKLFYYPVRLNEKRFTEDQILRKLSNEAVPDAIQATNRRYEMLDDMSYAKNHPDSVQWHLLLNNPHTSILMDNGFVTQKKDTNTYLYVAYYCPDVKIDRIPTMQSYAKRMGEPDSEDATGWYAIPIYPNRSPEQNLKQSILNQPNRLFTIWEEYPDKTKVYIAARKQEGDMNESLFKELVAAFGQEMTAKKIPLKSFKIQIH